jgi:hypothetical protein
MIKFDMFACMHILSVYVAVVYSLLVYSLLCYAAADLSCDYAVHGKTDTSKYTSDTVLTMRTYIVICAGAAVVTCCQCCYCHMMIR